MADMPRLMAIARRYGLIMIEDATEALGTQYIDGPFKGKFAGTIGDIGCYSFNGNKIITTSGGGMLLSDDEAGTCIIEMPDEIIDASASTQLKNIRDLIHEI